jgi:hypothetical protein
MVVLHFILGNMPAAMHRSGASEDEFLALSAFNER